MDWLLKTGAFLLAVIFFGAGAWELTLLIFAWLFVPPLLRLRRGRPAAQDGGKARGNFPAKSILGGLLLFLAFLGFLAHGSFSPIVFGSLGLLVVLWGRMPMAVPGSKLTPVEESILLRSSPLPFSWVAIAEVKLATKRVASALSSLDEQVVITEKSGRASILVVLRRTALSHRGAEDSVIERLGELARTCVPLGAYVLPMDSVEAADLLSLSTRPADFDPKGWLLALSTADYDLVSLDVQKGVVRGVGFYKTTPGDSPRVPPAGKGVLRALLLREVLEEAGKKAQWPSPDEYTAFLAGLFATRAEPLGQEIAHEAADGGEGQRQEVLVSSAGTQKVKLTRAQLRATVRAYQGRGG